MTPLISITLPSLYPDSAQRTVRNITHATRNSVEILVVSPFRVTGPNVVWIEENERRGCSAAHELAARHATGTFITPFADDHLYVYGWDVHALRNYEQRAKDWPIFSLGLRHVRLMHVGTNFGIYYPYFPLMTREHVERVGGWLSGDYFKGLSDSDLGMRVWASGGRCEYSERGLLLVHEDDRRKAGDGAAVTAADLALFLKKWDSRYGAGWHAKSLREFNHDFVPEDHPAVAKSGEFTIFYNDPSFMASLDGDHAHPGGVPTIS